MPVFLEGFKLQLQKRFIQINNLYKNSIKCMKNAEMRLSRPYIKSAGTSPRHQAHSFAGSLFQKAILPNLSMTFYKMKHMSELLPEMVLVNLEKDTSEWGS